MTTGAQAWGWLVRRDFLIYVAAAGGATLAAWFALDLWSMRWDVPLVYSGDALAVASHFKTVLETGWYEVQPALGAPFGQQYHDYPTAENLHFVVALILGTLFQNWAVALNVHFVLGFPLAALAMVWFLRRLGVSGVVTAVVAVLFAIAPYHFSRGEGHLFLAWYWVVPLALGLIHSMLRGEPIWGSRMSVPRGLGHALGRTGGTVTILTILGSASSYYSVFTLILGGLAAIAAVWVSRDWRRFWGALAGAGVLLIVMVANMAPDIIYRAVNGANSGALHRTPVESEIYALKLTQLLLPPAWHRFEPFRYLREQYDQHYPLPSESPALGIVAAIGFIALVVALFYLVASVAIARNPRHGGILTRLAPLGFLALAGFIFSTVGGLSTLISFVSTNLRAWNRMSIVIAALSLAAIAILLDFAIRWLASRWALTGLAIPLLVLAVIGPVAVVGVWDQTPRVDRAARAATIDSFDSDARFVSKIDARLPESALVFQLPYIDFPESPPVGRALDSDQLRPFLHTDNLRFSGGGIRGRADIDGLGKLAELPADEFLIGAKKIGYRGVIIDTFAYEQSADVDAVVAKLGSDRVDSPDGRFVFVGLAG